MKDLITEKEKEIEASVLTNAVHRSQMSSDILNLKAEEAYSGLCPPFSGNICRQIMPFKELWHEAASCAATHPWCWGLESSFCYKCVTFICCPISEKKFRVEWGHLFGFIGAEIEKP